MMFSFSTERFTEKEQRQLFLRRLIRRVFLEDWGTKVVALAITSALWLGVTGLRTPTTRRLKNTTLVTQIPNNMEITNTPIEEVEIVVTGDKRLVDRLNVRDLVVSVDLTEIKAGDRIVQLSPDTVNLELPNGIKLEEIQPNKIAVRLEKVEEREVTVKVETEGNLADGFEIYKTSIVPARVRVRGAESFVKSLDSVSTEKINVDNVKESFAARQIGLNIVNPKVTLLDTIVDVNFQIGEKRIEKTFVIPVKSGNESKNVTFTVWGGRSLVEKIQAEEIQVEIIRNENGIEIPSVVLPENLQNKAEILKPKIAS